MGFASRMSTREEQITNEIRAEFCDRVIPSDLIRYLPCLTPQDIEKVQAVEKQDGAISAAEILLQRLTRRADWLHELRRALLNKDVGLVDFGEKLQTICQRLTVTVDAEGACSDGEHCEPKMVVRNPTHHLDESSSKIQNESIEDMTKRVKLQAVEKLLGTIKTKDDIPEVSAYIRNILIQIDTINHACIEITFRMETVDQLDAFWQLYQTGGLAASLSRDILTPKRCQQLIDDARAEGVILKEDDLAIQVSIRESDFLFVRDSLSYKNVPLLARNTVESIILHGKDSRLQSQSGRNNALRKFRRHFPAKLQKIFDDPFVRDTIPEYFVGVVTLDAKDSVCHFYRLVTEKLNTEFTNESSDPNNDSLFYLAHHLSGCHNYESTFHTKDNIVELSAGARHGAVSLTNWKEWTKYFKLNGNKVSFASDLVLTYLAVKNFDIYHHDDCKNILKMDLFPVIAGTFYASDKMASLVEQIDFSHTTLVEYMYYKLLVTDSFQIDPVRNMERLNVKLTKEAIYLLNRAVREGGKLKLLLYLPKDTKCLTSFDSKGATIDLSQLMPSASLQLESLKLPEIALYRQEEEGFICFNDKSMVPTTLLLPDDTEIVMKFLLTIAQGINLLGTGEISVKKGTDPRKTIVQYGDVDKFYIINYNFVCLDTHFRKETGKSTKDETKSDGRTLRRDLDDSVGDLKVDLTSIHLSEEDISNVVNAFDGGLEVFEMNLSDTGITSVHTSKLFKAVIPSNLTQLIISGNTLFYGHSVETNGIGLRNLVSLEALEMRDCKIGDSGMINLRTDLAELRRLRSIDVSKNELSEKGLRSFCQSLRDNRTLRAIRVHENNIGPNGGLILSLFIDDLEYLEIINVCFCSLGSVGAEHLARALQNKDMKKMNFRGNDIKPDGSVEFFTLIKSCKNLNHFEYGKNEIGTVVKEQPEHQTRITAATKESSEEAASKAFTEMLTSCKENIEYLGLWNCGIAKSIKVDVFSNMPELVELVLQTNALDDTHAAIIGECLPSYKSLQVLMLRSNKIGPSGAKELTTGIEKCPSLEEIIIDRNKINDFEVLMNMVDTTTKALKNLKQLDLSYNVEMLMIAREDPKYKRLLETARRCLPDSVVEEGDMQTRVESKSTTIKI